MANAEDSMKKMIRCVWCVYTGRGNSFK